MKEFIVRNTTTGIKEKEETMSESEAFVVVEELTDGDKDEIESGVGCANPKEGEADLELSHRTSKMPNDMKALSCAGMDTKNNEVMSSS